MSLSLGAIGRMSGENGDTTSETSLGDCHPDANDKKMQHFIITNITDNAFCAFKKCTNSVSNYNSSGHDHSGHNSWRLLYSGFILYYDDGNDSRADFEDDCPEHWLPGHNTWFVVTLFDAITWYPSTPTSVKHKCLLNADNYTYNSSTHEGYDAAMFEMCTQNGVERPVCFRFGGELGGNVLEAGTFTYKFRWKDYVNAGTAGYDTLFTQTGTEN